VQTVTTVAELRALLDDQRRKGHHVGLVPTMGYLHEGHVSLIRRAAADCSLVVTTIFVNPLQFAPGEDLENYPRDPAGDSDKAGSAGSSVLFTPAESEMFPGGRASVVTTVEVAPLSATMEGVSRRTHFGGVCTIVAKLFNVVGTGRAYFGEKDYQQLAIIRRMTSDLSFPVEVVGCPVVREPDGLALSSRNVYLRPEERSQAPVLHRALSEGAAAIRSGVTDANEVRRAMSAVIATAPLAELDYVEVADPATLQPQTVAGRGSRLFGAVRFGSARLIDNVGVGE
jgi:pantoate--beta-alanine ligase